MAGRGNERGADDQAPLKNPAGGPKGAREHDEDRGARPRGVATAPGKD